MPPIFRDVRLQGRQFGDLIASRFAFGHALSRVGEQQLLATLTPVGDQIDHVLDLLDWNQRPKVARMALLLAGLAKEISGTTVNRLCGSSMDAISVAARAIKSGEVDLVIAAGVEQEL